jgi:AbrB family looped-hinge helix DNA binding protein
METKLSTKEQVVLPSSIRRRLGLRPGESLETEVVILTPRKKRSRKVRILADRLTGLPVLSVDPAQPLTSRQVREILAEIP